MGISIWVMYLTVGVALSTRGNWGSFGREPCSDFTKSVAQGRRCSDYLYVAEGSARISGVKRFIFSIMMFSSVAFADLQSDLGPIGKHFPIFVVEKSENPQNTLVAYTNLTSNCEIALDPDDKSKPLLDFYWLMDRRDFKRVHPLIKSGIRGRLELLTNASKQPHSFSIRINDLSELKQDLTAAILNVEATAQTNGACRVDASLKLGPSDRSKTIKLTSIYTESTTTIIPPFRRVVAVTLNGSDNRTGEKIIRKYVAK